ncbi:MAG: ribosome-binding factor A [Gammaproteobacteria bacterium HGW-Gammaproteobacteria-14]|nr:MAG: ribosome-binding factor A [Gammaproteobacteria bacterium HGW-Gammaproteobacteria-14]
MRHRRPQGFQRTDRIADQIQRELARLFREEMKDPRIGFVTVQDVRVSKDLGWADVYFTLLGKTAEDGADAEKVLSHAAGFLRTELAQTLNTRTTPRLRFHYDQLPERASEISALISRALAEDSQHPHHPDEDEDAQQ